MLIGLMGICLALLCSYLIKRFHTGPNAPVFICSSPLKDYALSFARLCIVLFCSGAKEICKLQFRSCKLQIKKPSYARLFVPKVGIEPTLLAEHEFESCASTNSATLAWHLIAPSIGSTNICKKIINQNILATLL